MVFTMSAEFEQRVRELFGEALDRPETERQRFLEAACSGDPEALEAVLRLLQAHGPASALFEEHSHRRHRIGRYAVVRELGRGAMGIVYDAIDPLICRNVAIKVIQLEPVSDVSDTQFMRERLLREARSAGGLSHSGIVTVFDVGEEGNMAFIAMERVDGPSLQGLLNSGLKLGRDEALDILRQTADALDHAHRHGVVHRDVKPGNIMLHEGRTVKITDFGIAKLTATQHQTLGRLMMGTPSYMSPEQIESPRQVDGRSDQFSLAVVAFELLTGNKPFHGESVSSMAHQVVYGPRPSARAVNPDLPAAVDEVFRRGLAKLPAERYGSCSELVLALERAVKSAGPSLPKATTATKRHLLSTVPFPYVLSTAIAVVGLFLVLLTSVHPPRRPVVNLPPPVVLMFTANPQSVPVGSSVTLRWEVRDATQVVIDQGIGDVPPNGAREMRPLVPSTYVLKAIGNGGGTSASVFVNVTEKTPGAKELYAEALGARQAGQIGKALALYQKAAELGEPRAMVDLGQIFLGDEVLTRDYKDYTEAVRSFRTAAVAGNSWGMVFLGGMYSQGTGVPKDDSLAADWYRKAADAGNPSAIFDLGEMYEDGQGVAKDLARANQLYHKAAALGNEEAKKRLAQMQGTTR